MKPTKVKEQIKIAAGAEMVYKQEDIQINGWILKRMQATPN